MEYQCACKVVMKLKALKSSLIAWGKKSLSSPADKVKIIRKSLGNIHAELASQSLSTNLQKFEVQLQAALLFWLGTEEDMLRQKSRESWLHLRDKNTKIFHSALKIKTARNHISKLITDSGNPVSDSETLRTLAPAYYEKLFNHSGYWTVFSKLVGKKKLTPRATSWLDRNDTDAEIHRALSDMPPDKGPGPDGYNARFFQHNWKLIGADVCHAIKSFFTSGKML